MKRDWDLIKTLLEAIEDDKLELYVRANLDKEQQIMLHLELLQESSLIVNYSTVNIPVDLPDSNIGSQEKIVFAPPPVRMTMQGYDLLETIRNKSIWKQITKKAYEAGTVVTWEFIKQAMPVIYKSLVD